MSPTLKKILPALLVVIGIAAVTLFVGNDEPAATDGDGSELTAVRYNMSWLPQGSQAGVFVAIEKGYYADAGLKVDPMRGFGGIRTVNELDQGMFEFAYADPLSVILSRVNGGSATMIGGINMEYPAGACFIAERHSVEKPADMSGLTFGAGQSSSIQALLPVLLEQNGVPASSVEMIQLDPSVVVSSLIEGRVDVAECWLGNSMALFQKKAIEAGLTIGRIAYADFGYDVYGSGIVARADYAADNPEIARKFLAATYKGYRDAAENPEEAAAILRAEHPLLDKDVTLQQIRETAALMQAEGGSIRLNGEKVARTAAFLEQAGQIEDADAVGAVHTNAYLDNPAS
jgi:NitT/TauT family transport system substrate-binding protein